MSHVVCHIVCRIASITSHACKKQTMVMNEPYDIARLGWQPHDKLQVSLVQVCFLRSHLFACFYLAFLKFFALQALHAVWRSEWSGRTRHGSTTNLWCPCPRGTQQHRLHWGAPWICNLQSRSLFPAYVAACTILMFDASPRSMSAGGISHKS